MKKVLIISKSKDLVKKHFYVIILFLITLIFFSGILSSSKTLSNIHYANDMTFQSENIRKYLHESGTIPLWTPYFYSGQPFIGVPEHYLFDLNFLYIFLFKNIFLAMNLAVISYFFLAGLGMYLLVYEIMRKQNAAFIAALIFMFNGLMQKFVIGGHLNILESYALIPFVFLFTYKSLYKKKWLNNSIIAAFFFSLMVYAGGIIFFLYTGLIIGVYMIWSLIGRNFKKRAVKVMLVSIVIITVLIGLSALKLLPILEFTKMSNRGAGVSYQEYLGYPIDLSDLWNHLINLSFSGGFSGAIGITSFILLLLGLLSFRKKIVLFSVLLIILSILLAAGTFVAKFFYTLPGFGQMRHIERVLIMFVFASPLIAAYGFNNLVNILRNYKKNIKEGLIFSVVLAILVIELVLLQKFPASLEIIEPNDIPIVNEISKDLSDFRTINIALSDLIGASGYNYMAQLDISSIKGGGGIWFNDYVGYLAIAQQTKSAKLWGLLNNKYVIAGEESGISGLKFIDKFEECEKCPIGEADGPYLYENTEFMPRAFYVDKGILVVGDKNNVGQIIYPVLLDENFNPRKAVIIQGKDSISSYNSEELKNYGAIIISAALISVEMGILENYVNNGGILLPDIFNNKNSINENDIKEMFERLDGNFEEIEILEYESNKAVYNIGSRKGFLVLSERFSNFPGWHASGKDKKEILRANGITTAVFSDNDEKITFKYMPQPFKKGVIISSITAIILIIYFSFNFIRKLAKR
ncbi:MAG: 6-pyruvoyl-tetrahydropterin synthase-related protein [Candidatus Woesearchaeota archaeon]|jgi:hypothetical protein|nr:6-pyruvoyl-tetrahydropterin synthase-related protein [Candidatus Woesearchaeota archaeon]